MPAIVRLLSYDENSVLGGRSATRGTTVWYTSVSKTDVTSPFLARLQPPIVGGEALSLQEPTLVAFSLALLLYQYFLVGFPAFQATAVHAYAIWVEFLYKCLPV